jgi:hypothetical protein
VVGRVEAGGEAVLLTAPRPIDESSHRNSHTYMTCEA